MPKLVHSLPAMTLHKKSKPAIVWFGAKSA
jgi:hypothetical protein